MTFLNGNLEEEVYMNQPEGFSENSHLVCKLKKSINGLKQASRQWFMKFHNIVTSFGFIENVVDSCLYLKVNGSKFMILVLYVDDILLTSSDLALLHETKSFFSQNFNIKNSDETSYVIIIQIHRDKSEKILNLSQKTYIKIVLGRIRM